MPSPFPGMDPYLESEKHWPEFHNALAFMIKTQLVPQLRPKYKARVEPILVYEAVETGDQHFAYPDVAVLRENVQTYTPVDSINSITFIAPPEPVIPLRQDVEFELEFKLMAVDIYTTQDEQLVTSLEILSPANKVRGSRTYKQYIRKRKRILNSTANWLELDLFRAGSRIILGQPLPDAPYFAALSRAINRPKVEVWPMFWHKALPLLPIPLLTPDSDASLDLNAVLTRIYDNAGYDYDLDYALPPPPPTLSSAEMTQLKAFL